MSGPKKQPTQQKPTQIVVKQAKLKPQRTPLDVVAYTATAILWFMLAYKVIATIAPFINLVGTAAMIVFVVVLWISQRGSYWEPPFPQYHTPAWFVPADAPIPPPVKRQWPKIKLPSLRFKFSVWSPKPRFKKKQIPRWDPASKWGNGNPKGVPPQKRLKP